MEARPLPLRNIAIVVCALGVLSLLAQFFGFRMFHAIALFGCFGTILYLIAHHFYLDQTRTTFRNFEPKKTLLVATLVWLPFILLLTPGILLTLWLDEKVDLGLRMAEASALGTYADIERQIVEERERRVQLSWLYPPN